MVELGTQHPLSRQDDCVSGLAKGPKRALNPRKREKNPSIHHRFKTVASDATQRPGDGNLLASAPAKTSRSASRVARYQAKFPKVVSSFLWPSLKNPTVGSASTAERLRLNSRCVGPFSQDDPSQPQKHPDRGSRVLLPTSIP